MPKTKVKKHTRKTKKSGRAKVKAHQRKIKQSGNTDLLAERVAIGKGTSSDQYSTRTEFRDGDERIEVLGQSDEPLESIDVEAHSGIVTINRVEQDGDKSVDIIIISDTEKKLNREFNLNE